MKRIKEIMKQLRIIINKFIGKGKGKGKVDPVL
jgi:hypothetical protein